MIYCAISERYSKSIWSPFLCNFSSKIAILVSKSGAWISATNPFWNLEVILSSKRVNSFGGRSEEIIICFFFILKSLKRLWNTSWVLSFHAKNWISSTSKTSTFSNFFSNFGIVLFLSAFTISWIRFELGK